MTDDRETTSHRVYDGERELQFTGILVADESSKRHSSDRWMEVKIYLTAAGSWVVTIIGRTIHAHETERHKAQVSDTAVGAVESLYAIDDDGVKYMTNTAKRAARAAAAFDPEFARAYLIEHVA